MTTVFALLCDRCGLSQQEAADFLGVRLDTIKSWSSGRRMAPAGVIAQVRALYDKIERAADQAIELIGGEEKDAEVELGYAADDAEAQSLGWPCVGAQLASLGIAAATIDNPVKIVPRGSSSASAAAADIHDKR